MKITTKSLLQRICIALCICILAACAAQLKSNALPPLFANALIAEPIKMRAGYVHTTQPFEIKDPAQVWEVNLGFVRKDDVLPMGRFFCMVTSTKDSMQRKFSCPLDDSNIKVQWELLRADQSSVGKFEYDAKVKDANSQSSRADYLVGLGAFSKQAPGQYRVRITILADIPELDITTPHLVIATPFFNRQR